MQHWPLRPTLYTIEFYLHFYILHSSNLHIYLSVSNQLGDYTLDTSPMLAESPDGHLQHGQLGNHAGVESARPT